MIKIPKPLKYVLILLCIALFSGPYLLYKGLYWHGLRYLPEECQPIRDNTLPDHLLELTWQKFRGTGPRRMTPIRFDHYLRMFIRLQSDSETPFPLLTPSSAASSQVARLLLRDTPHLKPLEWQIVWASTAIWFSHNWTIDETLSTILHASYYGHGMYGIAQAAEGCFARTPDRLSPEESAVLITMISRPGGFNPWCNPENNLQRANKLLLKIQGQSAMPKLPNMLVPAPEGACSKSSDSGCNDDFAFLAPSFTE